MSSEQVNEEDTTSEIVEEEKIEDNVSEDKITLSEDAGGDTETGDGDKQDEIAEKISEEKEVEEETISVHDLVQQSKISQQDDANQNADILPTSDVEEDVEAEKIDELGEGETSTQVDREEGEEDEKDEKDEQEKPKEEESEDSIPLSEERKSEATVDEIAEEDEYADLKERESMLTQAGSYITSASYISSALSEASETEKMPANFQDYVKKYSDLFGRLSKKEEEPCDEDAVKAFLKVDLQELISGYKSEDKLMKDSLAAISGLVRIRQDLICIKNEPIILRKDYKCYKGVRILSGGHMGHEPLFTDYVGKGMLTGVVLGTVSDPPSVAAVTKAMQELVINSPGLLIIIHNNVEYRLIFGLAMERIRMEGHLNVDMVVVGDDCYERCRSPVGRRGLAGIILLYKLAGSMADCERSFREIYISLRSASKTIVTISCLTKPFKAIGSGMVKNAKDGINFNGDHTQMIRRMLDYCLAPTKYFSMRLDPNDSLIVLINNYRSLSPEFYTIVDRVLKELELRRVKISRVYANNFITGFWPGFSISLMIDVFEYRTKYLDSPTTVSLWPRNASDGKPSSYLLSYDKKKFQEMGPMLSHHDTRMVKNALVSACKSLVLCETVLNTMHFFGNYGTKLKFGAEAVLKASKQSLINFSRPFNLLIEISEILIESIPGATGAMYGCLFEGAARSFLRSPLTTVTSQNWSEAMDEALKTLRAYTNAKGGIVSLALSLIPVVMAIHGPFISLPQTANTNPILNALETLRLEIENRRKTTEGEDESRFKNQLDVESYAIIIWLHAVYSSIYWKTRFSTTESATTDIRHDPIRRSTDKSSTKSSFNVKTTGLTRHSSLLSHYSAISHKFESKNELLGRKSQDDRSHSFASSRSSSQKDNISARIKGINKSLDFISEATEEEEINDDISIKLSDQIGSQQSVASEEKSIFSDLSGAMEEQSIIHT